MVATGCVATVAGEVVTVGAVDEIVVEADAIVVLLDALVVELDPVVVVAPDPVQDGRATVSVSRVTAPLRANRRPSMVTPVLTVILVSARIDPRKTDPTPSVAELPTCQKTLHDWVPFTNWTTLDDAVMSVEPAWKTNTAAGSPPASRVNVPVSANDEADP